MTLALFAVLLAASPARADEDFAALMPIVGGYAGPLTGAAADMRLEASGRGEPGWAKARFSFTYGQGAISVECKGTLARERRR